MCHHINEHWALDDKGTGSKLVDQVRDYVKRAQLLLLPVQSVTHWTLLALSRRSDEKLSAKVACAPDPSAEDTEPSLQTQLCTKCHGKGCLACKIEKAVNYGLNPTELVEPLPDCDLWEYRYYDSLDTPSEESAKLASAIMYALQPDVRFGLNMPTESTLRANRANTLTQGPTAQCGWYTLHFLEEEIRRFRGEGLFSFEFNKKVRVEVLQKLHDRLVDLASKK